MPVAVMFFAVAAGLIGGELSRDEDIRILWVALGGVLGLFGLAVALSYLRRVEAMREALRDSALESAATGTTTHRVPGQGGDGWRLRMALVGLLGAVAGLFAGYAAYRAVRDGGSWTIAALLAPFGAMVAGMLRTSIIPDAQRKRIGEIMARQMAGRAGAENVVVENEEGVEVPYAEAAASAEGGPAGAERLAAQVEARLAGLEALREAGEISAEEHAQERRRILGEI